MDRALVAEGMTTEAIARELASAVERRGVGENRFTKCSAATAAEIMRVTKARFVRGEPTVWWLGFDGPYESCPYGSIDDWRQKLRALVHDGPSSRCWLVVEAETDAPLVYDAEAGVIAELLGECSFFEYYLVSKDYDWLIADTDHNQFLVVRTSGWSGASVS